MTSPAFPVRPMTVSDYSALADLIGEWRPGHVYKLRARLLRSTLDAVAVLDGEIVGWISYKITRCNSDLIAEYESSSERWLYVVEMYVNKAMRGRRIGESLLSFVEDQGRRQGVRYSILMPEQGMGAAGFTEGLYEFYSRNSYRLMQPSPEWEGRDPWIMGLQL